MNERALIASLVRRHLKHAAGFELAPEGAPPPDGAEADERRIGDYKSACPDGTRALVFTDRALYVDGTQRQRVPWSEVVDYELPASKRAVDGVRVLTTSGAVFVPMCGERGPTGKFKDAFDMIRLLEALRDRRARERDR